jgi:hypothetical protein
MKGRIDMDKIARGLGAERRGKVAAPGSYFGAIQLLADIEVRFRHQAAAGRRTPLGRNGVSSRSRRERSSGSRRSRRRCGRTA